MSSLDLKTTEQIKRWRLILGREAETSLASLGGDTDRSLLSGDEVGIDEALAAIYDSTDGDQSSSERAAGLGKSSPRIAKWLGDIRTYFKEDLVTVIQQDAIERKGLKQLLLEPEMLKSVQPNVALVGTLMSLRGKIPEKSKDTARIVVRAVVDEIKKRLEQKIRQAVTGALNRKTHSPLPNPAAIDWRWTIGRNLKHFNKELETIIPEKVYFYSRRQQANNWTVIVNMDQSGSMADSVVYGAVCGSIFASLPALKTHVVAFDTEVVDLTESCGDDPIEMLFGVQLGGGTDINKSVAYCQQFIKEPSRTLFIMITDLFEGGNQAELVKRVRDMVESGVRVICLLSLCDSGVPAFDEALAKKLASLGVPCFACTPNKLPDLMEAALKGKDLAAFVTSAKPDKREL